MIRTRLLQVFLFLVCTAFTTAAQDVSNQLNSDWNGKVFVLKHCCEKEQVFDQNGDPVGMPQSKKAGVPVTLKSLKLKGDSLEIKAQSVAINFSAREHFAAFTGKDFRITVKFDQIPQSQSVIDSAISKTFLPFNFENPDQAPDYMQACARGQIRNFKAGWRCELDGVWDSDNYRTKKENRDPVPREVLDFRKIGENYVAEKVAAYRVNREKGVLPPSTVFDPDPEYPREARAARVTATLVLRVVIDEQGKAGHIQVVGPAGYGLEQAAVEAVKTWVFKPATYQGKAVPVVALVEVNFRIG